MPIGLEQFRQTERESILYKYFTILYFKKEI